MSSRLNVRAERLEEVALGLLSAGWDMHLALERVAIDAGDDGAEVDHLLLPLKRWEGLATCLLERPDLEARAAALDARLDEIEARPACRNCAGAGELVDPAGRERVCPSCGGTGRAA